MNNLKNSTGGLHPSVYSVLTNLIQISKGDKNTWTLWKSEHGFRTFLLNHPELGRTFISQSRLIKFATIERICEYLTSTEKLERRQWDPLLLQSEIVDKLEFGVEIIYLCYFVLGCFGSPRDYCLLQHVHQDSVSGFHFVVLCSTNSALCPVRYPRAQMKGGYILQKLDGGIQLYYVHTGNVGGLWNFAPHSWFTDDFILQRSQCVEGIRLYLDGDGSNPEDISPPSSVIGEEETLNESAEVSSTTSSVDFYQDEVSSQGQRKERTNKNVGSEKTSMKRSVSTSDVPSSSNMIQVTVESAVEKKDSSSSYVAYEIKVTTKTKLIKTLRRYSEFVAFHQYLEHNHPQFILPSLPPKTFGKASKQEIDKRLKDFNTFLQAIVRQPSLLRDDPRVKRFLGFKSQEML